MADLAIKGEAPEIARGAIEEVWPIVSEDDVAAVVAALRSGKLSWASTDDVPALEHEWAEYVGSRYCIALNSGTAALHAAVAAAGVEPGDEVLVPALTFLASASSVIHHQGIPVFVDVDPNTFTIRPDDIEARVTSRTRAIIVVHLHGLPADMAAINQIAARRGLIVIEDAAQAPGALYKGQKVGSLGHMGCFSIMAGKNLPTAGEGGLFTTDDVALRDRADMVKMFGERANPGQVRDYNALTMGWNYRFSSILAAFTRSQLRRLDRHTEAVQENSEYLSKHLAEIPGLVPPEVPADRTHVYHHYRIKVDPVAAGVDLPVGIFRQALEDALSAEGMAVVKYQNRPLPGQDFFQRREGYGKGCPWTCGFASRDVTYDSFREYEHALEVIRGSFLIGRRLCMATFMDRGNIDRYVNVFEKVFANLDEVVEHGRGLDYQDPWEEATRLWY